MAPMSISGGKFFAEILLNNSRGDFNPSDNSFRATSLLKMAHGGTNFGFLSGANTDSIDESAYKPDLTSYDYDAPIKEYGDVNNAKYEGMWKYNVNLLMLAEKKNGLV